MTHFRLWDLRRLKKSSWYRWLPVLGAAILVIVMAVVTGRALSNFRDASAWRKHTVEVILTADSFQNNLQEIQRNLRSYVTTGDTNALARFEVSAKMEPQQFDRLVELTPDNPAQKQRLKEIRAAMDNLFSYDNHMLDIFKRQGARAVINADIAGITSRAVFRAADGAVDAFSAEEQKLLSKRDAAEEFSYRNARRLLAGGSLVAILLLIFSGVAASRQLAFRHRAEAQLSYALMLQKAILNSADYAIVTANPDGIIQTFNPAAERLLGYSAGEIIGRETLMLWRDPQEVAERAQKLSAELGVPVRPSFDAVAKKVQFDEIDEGEWTFIGKDGRRFIASLVVSALSEPNGNFAGYVGIFHDISARKNIEAEREQLILKLKEALAQVRTLTGLIPICGWCKNIRNDQGYWSSVEHYVRERTDAHFTHGICPDCQEKFKQEIARANGGQLIESGQ